MGIKPEGTNLTVSVIIPVWNGRSHLAECLDSLLAQDSVSLEIIAVDNASVDGSPDFITERYSLVRLIRQRQNLGFSGGCNAGLRVAHGEFLILLNQDVRVEPGWLEAVLAAFAAQPSAGIVGGLGLYPETHHVQHAGGWIDWPLGYARHYGYGSHAGKEWREPRQVEFVTGAALAIRRPVIEVIGFLDEGFWPGYFEDIDYCLRAQAAGFQVWYWPSAVFLHHESASSEAGARSESYQRGRLRMALKHLSPARFLEEFAPAELAHLPGAVTGGQARPLRRAYLTALLTLPQVVPGFGPEVEARREQIGKALQQLSRQAWQLAWSAGLETARAEVSLPSGVVPAEAEDLSPAYVEAVQTRRSAAAGEQPAFKEYQFRSQLPIIGPWVARLRAWWYALAARWAVLYVMQQQEAWNRQQATAWQELAARLQDLADENLWLTERLAHLSVEGQPRSDDDSRHP
jgi:GT2 family glycosyltransferase